MSLRTRYISFGFPHQAAYVLAFFFVPGILAQEEPLPRPAGLSGPQEKLVGPADWHKINSLTENILDTTFTREKWGGDYDRFWLSLYLDQYQANWFDFDARMKIMSEHLTRRYNLREEQLPQVKQLLLRETGAFLFQNGREVMNFAGKLQAERLWDKPFDAQTAGQWAQMHAPLLSAFGQSADRFSADFAPLLDETQRSLFESDRAQWKERIGKFQTLVTKWQSGDWTPEEWGLNPDGTIPLSGDALRHLHRKIRQGRAQATPQISTSQPQEPAPDPLDADGWTKLVEAYIAYYGLEPAVAGSARAILRDVQQRYAPRQKQFAQDAARLNQLLEAEKLTPERQKSLAGELTRQTLGIQAVHDRLLAELVQRLDKLLSTKQQALPPMPGRPVTATQPKQ